MNDLPVIHGIYLSPFRFWQKKRIPFVVFTISNILILMSFAIRIVSVTSGLNIGQNSSKNETSVDSDSWSVIESTLLSIALPLAWFFLIFFAGGMKLTGPNISMIRYMLTQDMRQFSVIYLIFIYAFSQGEYKKYRDIFFQTNKIGSSFNAFFLFLSNDLKRKGKGNSNHFITSSFLSQKVASLFLCRRFN